jgi:hypothetical protein
VRISFATSTTVTVLMPSGLEELIKRILITHEKREPMSPMDRGLCIEG